MRAGQTPAESTLQIWAGPALPGRGGQEAVTGAELTSPHSWAPSSPGTCAVGAPAGAALRGQPRPVSHPQGLALSWGAPGWGAVGGTVGGDSAELQCGVPMSGQVGSCLEAELSPRSPLIHHLCRAFPDQLPASSSFLPAGSCPPAPSRLRDSHSGIRGGRWGPRPLSQARVSG